MRTNNLRYQINSQISKFISFCNTEFLPSQSHQRTCNILKPCSRTSEDWSFRTNRNDVFANARTSPVLTCISKVREGGGAGVGGGAPVHHGGD
ncbi:hypothetical protein EE612_002601, partial [Oryza sativa]